MLSFTGRFDLIEQFVFMAVFLVVFYGFDRFVVWSERFDRFPSAIGTGPSFTRVVGDVSY